MNILEHGMSHVMTKREKNSEHVPCFLDVLPSVTEHLCRSKDESGCSSKFNTLTEFERARDFTPLLTSIYTTRT